MVKNKGLIAEAYEWDEEEVSSYDNEMVEVKVLMALAEENDVVSKKGARNDKWVKISMRKLMTQTIPGVERPWLSEAEGFILPNHDIGRILPSESQRNTTDSLTLKSILRSKSKFKAEALKDVTINDLSSTPAKGNKSYSASKVHSAPAERKINPRNPQHAFKKGEACGSPNHTTTDHYDIEWFKRRKALQAKKAEALKSTRAESSNANRSKTPIKSGCPRHMTGVKSYLHRYMEQPGPKVVFRDDSTCITLGYGSIKCNGIVFTKFDEKRETIFNSKKEVVMISLRHKRLAHLIFKTINKLAKQNLVFGLPSLVYSKDKPCSAYKKRKHHRASFKTKQTSSINKCLYLLHMDLFGPVTPRFINHEKYTLVIVDEYSRYTWVYFLKTKSQAPETIMSFIKIVENQNDIKVKQLRTDNGTEFKNNILVNFSNEKRISQNFSSPYTPEQNGIAERKNRTLIKAARAMLSGFVFSKQYWTEVVATACYTQSSINVPTADVYIAKKFATVGDFALLHEDKIYSESKTPPPEETAKDKGMAGEVSSSTKKKGRTVVITAEDIQKRKIDVKARTTILLALPDEHQQRFSKYDSAKELWEAILKTFSRNEATKKTKKNQLKKQYGASIASAQVPIVSTDVVAASLSYDTVCAFITTQLNGSQIKYEDISQINDNDIEEMDIKWNLALLSMRADRSSRSQDRGKRKSYKKDPKVEEPAPKAMIAIDGIGWDWSYIAEEDEASKNHALVVDEEESQKLDKDKKGVGFNEYCAVPPPPAQVYSPLKKDLSWIVLLEFVDDIVTDYTRPTTSIDVSKSVSKEQEERWESNNPSFFEQGGSSDNVLSKPMIKFVKESGYPNATKANNTENARKPTVKYAEMYRNTPQSIPQNNIDDKGYWDSGCSRNMTGNISYLSDYEPFNRGYVSFGHGR
nr:retrovirus-related Pol polyprotein from transposon TNT 1-94 [Tanacetum cinerariifolium]